MIGMRIKVEEVGNRIGMTAFAGFEPVRTHRQPGARIADGQDIVGPVAIGTFGSRPIAQIGERPMQAQLVMLRWIDMAVAAAVCGMQAEGGRLRVGHVVPLVAVGTTWMPLDFAAIRGLLGGPTQTIAATMDAIA